MVCEGARERIVEGTQLNVFFTERLIGVTRATLLTGLDEPASTTWLARRHELAPGTVSEHLKVLREAGLVVGERHRHEVRYRRTRLGSALTRGSE